MLIAVEGIDGTGKTTISKYIVEILRKKGFDCVLLREPGDSKYGKKLRNARKRLEPEMESELFILDREEDVKNNIIPALKNGKIVVMDRYYYSNVAYQGARGLDPGKIKEKNERIAPKPDLVILLDAKPEIAIERIKLRGEMTPFEDLEYLKKVRENFKKYADSNTVVIDATKPLEDVKREVREIICRIIKNQLQAKL